MIFASRMSAVCQWNSVRDIVQIADSAKVSNTLQPEHLPIIVS
jgi:hypothetical protein